MVNVTNLKNSSSLWLQKLEWLSLSWMGRWSRSILVWGGKWYCQNVGPLGDGDLKLVEVVGPWSNHYLTNKLSHGLYRGRCVFIKAYLPRMPNLCSQPVEEPFLCLWFWWKNGLPSYAYSFVPPRHNSISRFYSKRSVSFWINRCIQTDNGCYFPGSSLWLHPFFIFLKKMNGIQRLSPRWIEKWGLGMELAA